MSKKCSICLKHKDLKYFHISKNTKTGLSYDCKECSAKRVLKYRKTKTGLINLLFNSQYRRSKRRGHEPPNYTKQGFNTWILSQQNFKKLYDNWVKSGYDKWLKPSVDRIDNYKGYCFDNIQLVTWKENYEKGHADRKNGVNNKQLNN